MRYFTAGIFLAALLQAQVSYERIVNADKEPQNWLYLFADL